MIHAKVVSSHLHRHTVIRINAILSLIPRIVAVSSERIACKPLAPTRLSRAFLGFAFRLMRSGSRLASLRQPPGGSDPTDGDALASLRLANARLRPSGG